jgi:hypothetical protein
MYLRCFISDLQACQISVIMADKRDSNWSSAEASTALAVRQVRFWVSKASTVQQDWNHRAETLPCAADLVSPKALIGQFFAQVT